VFAGGLLCTIIGYRFVSRKNIPIADATTVLANTAATLRRTICFTVAAMTSAWKPWSTSWGLLLGLEIADSSIAFDYLAIVSRGRWATRFTEFREEFEVSAGWLPPASRRSEIPFFGDEHTQESGPLISSIHFISLKKDRPWRVASMRSPTFKSFSVSAGASNVRSSGVPERNGESAIRGRGDATSPGLESAYSRPSKNSTIKIRTTVPRTPLGA
jgi:hypothetical protein